MAQSNVVLLENARSARERAAKARRLALGIGDIKAIAHLHRYADELEEQAKELERLAAQLGQTVGRTQQLSAELREAVEAIQRTVDGIKKDKV